MYAELILLLFYWTLHFQYYCFTIKSVRRFAERIPMEYSSLACKVDDYLWHLMHVVFKKNNIVRVRNTVIIMQYNIIGEFIFFLYLLLRFIGVPCFQFTAKSASVYLTLWTNSTTRVRWEMFLHERYLKLTFLLLT